MLSEIVIIFLAVTLNTKIMSWQSRTLRFMEGYKFQAFRQDRSRRPGLNSTSIQSQPERLDTIYSWNCPIGRTLSWSLKHPPSMQKSFGICRASSRSQVFLCRSRSNKTVWTWTIRTSHSTPHHHQQSRRQRHSERHREAPFAPEYLTSTRTLALSWVCILTARRRRDQEKKWLKRQMSTWLSRVGTWQSWVAMEDSLDTAVCQARSTLITRARPSHLCYSSHSQSELMCRNG